jgi:hypothetical protein
MTDDNGYLTDSSRYQGINGIAYQTPTLYRQKDFGTVAGLMAQSTTITGRQDYPFSNYLSAFYGNSPPSTAHPEISITWFSRPGFVT